MTSPARRINSHELTDEFDQRPRCGFPESKILRMAAHGGSELERGEIDVAGVRRSYWLARAPRWPGQPPPPLLIALHGSGMGGMGGNGANGGKGMAWFTG